MLKDEEIIEEYFNSTKELFVQQIREDIKNLTKIEAEKATKEYLEKADSSVQSKAMLNSVGVALGVVLSWSVNKSILWGIFHGFCSWFYVIYYVIKLWWLS